MTADSSTYSLANFPWPHIAQLPLCPHGLQNCSLGLPGAHLLTNFNKRGKLLPVSTYLLTYLLINVSTWARANSAG